MLRAHVNCPTTDMCLTPWKGQATKHFAQVAAECILVAREDSVFGGFSIDDLSCSEAFIDAHMRQSLAGALMTEGPPADIDGLDHD